MSPEEPPSYYAPIQVQLDKRCENLCKKIKYLFYGIIAIVGGIYISIFLHRNELSEFNLAAEWFFGFHLAMLALMSCYGILAAKKQSRKHFKPVLCYAVYSAFLIPVLRFVYDCFQKPEVTDSSLRSHAESFSLLLTVVSCIALFPIYSIHHAFKQAEFFKDGGVLLFPEGTYEDSK
ncbi:hypothetical protein FO519_009153 [Halicephalobus sp. NKZ332]|nr:hypothetical protein FO519_009153 [Halicephalobus sp. NKZ332]